MSDSRSQKPVTSRNFNDVTPIVLEMSPATSSAQHERISCILLLSSERKIVNKLCFLSIFKVQTVCTHCLHPFQDSTNTLSCSKFILNC